MIVGTNYKSDRLDESGIFYFKGQLSADGDSGWYHGHNWKIGTELNDYITNQNGGSGVFDWTIEVGFKSSNTDHWMVNANADEGSKFPSDNLISTESGVMRTTSANTFGGQYSYPEGEEVRHGSNHPSLDHWSELESFVHRHIIRIVSPRTLYSEDSSGAAAVSYTHLRLPTILLV